MTECTCIDVRHLGAPEPELVPGPKPCPVHTVDPLDTYERASLTVWGVHFSAQARAYMDGDWHLVIVAPGGGAYNEIDLPPEDVAKLTELLIAMRERKPR